MSEFPERMAARMQTLALFLERNRKKIFLRKHQSIKKKNFMTLYFLKKKQQRVRWLNHCMLMIVLPSDRRFWCHDRKDHWFFILYRNRHNDMFHERWISLFRMSAATFDQLVDLVRLSMEKRNTRYRKSIPVPHRVAVAVFRLASGASTRMIGEVLSVGASSVCEISMEFCTVLHSLQNKFIKFPVNGQEVTEAIHKFTTINESKIAMIVGAVDGTHIPIIGPEINRADYFNRKQRYSFNTQAIVGGNLEFLSVSTGFPSCMHDSRAFTNSHVYRKCNQKELLNDPIVNISGVNVRPVLIGDSAYGLQDWLMTPFSNPGMNEREFNREFSKVRSSVERAFGVLKGRWRCLLKRLDNYTENASKVIIACCILHNMCQMNGEEYADADLETLIAQERQLRNLQNRLIPRANPAGYNIRRALMDDMNTRI